MSDMSRPAAPPSAAEHERHDVLLVAQLTAGDQLSQAQLAEGQHLLETCGQCAALAADLRTVSMAVAAEPVPPRRRDFRLSPPQAEALSGNALARWLRGLSLPTSRAFQPLAAGALSVGLLFVVAGYAWPDSGVVSVQAEPNLGTYADPSAAAAPAEVSTTDLSEEAASAFLDPEFSESLDEHQAGTSERALQKSTTSGPEAPELDAMELEAPAAAALEASSGSAQGDGRGSDESSAGAVAADADVMAEQAAEDVALDAVDDGLEAGAVVPAETTATNAAADLPTDGNGPEELLIVLGSLLALGGGGLFLLGWLVRRSSDPLLR